MFEFERNFRKLSGPKNVNGAWVCEFSGTMNQWLKLEWKTREAADHFFGIALQKCKKAYKAGLTADKREPLDIITAMVYAAGKIPRVREE
jgi:hypothetical protein